MPIFFFWHLTHLIKVGFWCFVCQIPKIQHLTHMIPMLLVPCNLFKTQCLVAFQGKKIYFLYNIFKTYHVMSQLHIKSQLNVFLLSYLNLLEVYNSTSPSSKPSVVASLIAFTIRSIVVSVVQCAIHIVQCAIHIIRYILYHVQKILYCKC